MKKVTRHMKLLGCSSVEGYLDKLSKDQMAEEVLLSFLRITISRFFRDRQLWYYLADKILPFLHQQTTKLNIWSAGCSCGEEVYSLCILHHMHWPDTPSPAILATDASIPCLERARSGIYKKSSLRELDSTLVSTYFSALYHQNAYRIRPFCRQNISWTRHDFLSPPPGNGFHIIFLRNSLLTYYTPRLQADVLSRILQSLLPGGFVIIGSHENLPNLPFPLIELDKCSMIYQKKIERRIPGDENIVL